jgi:hypothetical protein
VVNAIKRAFPPADPQLDGEAVIVCRLTKIERALLLEQVYIPDKSGIKLKQLVSLDEAAPQPKKKSASQ